MTFLAILLLQRLHIRLADRGVLLCLGDCVIDVLDIVNLLVTRAVCLKNGVHLVDLIEKSVGYDDSFQFGVDGEAHRVSS